jgi:hypothetical protein
VHPKQQTSIENGSSVFYCPMFCEGEKTYPTQSGCPVKVKTNCIEPKFCPLIKALSGLLGIKSDIEITKTGKANKSYFISHIQFINIHFYTVNNERNN